MSDPIAHDLAARGYLVLCLAPNQVFRYIAFPNEHTDRLAPSWVAVHEPNGGFSEVEARLVALDRGGALV
jgi:hypothetical protein